MRETSRTLVVGLVLASLAACGGSPGAQQASTTPAAATTQPTTTVAPTTAQASTTAAPTTTVAPTSTVGLPTIEEGAEQYLAIAGAYNAELDRIDAEWGSGAIGDTAACDAIQSGEKQFSDALSEAAWPAGAQQSIDELVRASQNIQGQGACEASEALNEAAGLAATAVRIALGLPVERG